MKNSFAFAILSVCLFPAFQARAWTVDVAIGDVSIELPNHQTHPAASNEVLEPGSAVVTGAGAKAMLVDGASEICISGDSRFVIESAPEADKKKLGLLHLLQGRVRAKFIRPPEVSEYPYEVKMRSAVAGVRGTEFFVLVTPEAERISTVKGLVHVASIGDATETWDVPAGKTAIKKEGAKAEMRDSDRAEIRKWERESRRERKDARAKMPVEVHPKPAHH